LACGLLTQKLSFLSQGNDNQEETEQVIEAMERKEEVKTTKQHQNIGTGDDEWQDILIFKMLSVMGTVLYQT